MVTPLDMLLDRLGNEWVLPAEFRPKDIQIGLLPDEFIGKFGELLDHFRRRLSSIGRGLGSHLHLPECPVTRPALPLQARKLIFANVPEYVGNPPSF
jgi:hypothetical protein